MMEEKEIKNYLMFMHLSQLTIFFIPLGNIIIPLLMWVMRKDEHPDIDRHGKDILNFEISITIYLLISAVLLLLVVGLLLLILIGLYQLVIIIVNTVKVAQGNDYHYNFTINFIK